MASLIIAYFFATSGIVVIVDSREVFVIIFWTMTKAHRPQEIQCTSFISSEAETFHAEKRENSWNNFVVKCSAYKSLWPGRLRLGLENLYKDSTSHYAVHLGRTTAFPSKNFQISMAHFIRDVIGEILETGLNCW